MEKVPRKTARTLRLHLEEVIEIAWDHDAEEAYRIAREKWEIGSSRSFRDFLNKQHITTYQKTAAETMTLEEKVNQLFMITPEALTGVGTVIQAGDGTREALAEHPVGGLIYFAQNIGITLALQREYSRYGVDVSFFTLYGAVPQLLEESGTTGVFLKDLLIGYALTALASFATVRSMLQNATGAYKTGRY